MSNEKTEITNISFIDHKPIGDDLFEGQPQKRIADSISYLIKSNQMENKLIGLDGPWGAGKSNLVKMLAENLKDTHHFFYFDAWGHQEDLQRRAFLEELTESLSCREIIAKDIWLNRVKALLSRQKETTTKTVPKISSGVIITLLLILVAPIAIEIAQLVENALWRLSIAFFPFILGITVYMIASCIRGGYYSFQELYALYSDQQTSNETHTTISEKEPTVKEFKNWMEDLSCALGENKNNLVIVFDNIDRLPSEKVRQVWSSVHTFFSETTYKNIWVIVPFDKVHLRDVFCEESDFVLKQFLNKTFSVVLRVSLPVLTDWQAYFNKKFKEAFGENENAECDLVRKIFDSFEADITPRKIIGFINELVALKHITEQNVPLRYIALFVEAKEEILKNPVNQILEKRFLAACGRLFNNDQDLQDNIAALVYNVPVSLASQVTLTREIQSSLNINDPSRLKELANHVHFADILEQVVTESYFDVANACQALSIFINSSEKDWCGKSQAERVWDGLCNLKLQESIEKQEFEISHKILLKHVSKAKREILCLHIVEGIRGAEEFNGAVYCQNMKAIEGEIKEISEKFDFDSYIEELSVSPKIYIEYLSEAGELYMHFGLRCDLDQLVEYIVEKAPDQLEGLRVVSVVKELKENQVLKDKLTEYIEDDLITVENVAPFFQLYRAISLKKPIKCIGESKVVELFSAVEEGSQAELELLAMRFAYGSSIAPQGGRIDLLVEYLDEQRIDQISQIVEFYQNFGNLLVDCIDWHPGGFKRIVKNLILKSYGTSRLSITDVLTRFNEICAILDVSPEKLMQRLDSWNHFAKKDITHDNVESVIVDSDFYESAVKIKCELTEHVLRMVRWSSLVGQFEGKVKVVFP